METKQCRTCKKDFAATEEFFYLNKGTGNLYTRCKTCHKKVSNSRSEKDKTPPAHETRTVAWLQSHGVIAFAGKHLRLPNFKHVDVIAFGCLKVECKIPQKDNRIHFTYKQRRTRYHADIIIIERDESLYSVFPITYAGFYEDGKLGRAIQVDNLECDKYLNRVDVIEAVFRQKRMALMKQTMNVGEQLTLPIAS